MENFISPLRFKKSHYVIRLSSNKDSHCAKQGNEGEPCFRGWRYGCHQKQCWRTKYRSTSSWYWMAKNSKGAAVKCDINEDCLEYWRGLEEAVSGDIPCYYSGWYHYPCYMGLRYGCSEEKFVENHRYVTVKVCWYENPTSAGGYSWIVAHGPNSGQVESFARCGKHEDFKRRAGKEIRDLGEDIVGLIVM